MKREMNLRFMKPFENQWIYTLSFMKQPKFRDCYFMKLVISVSMKKFCTFFIEDFFLLNIQKVYQRIYQVDSIE